MSATTAKLGSAIDTTPVTNERHSSNLGGGEKKTGAMDSEPRMRAVAS